MSISLNTFSSQISDLQQDEDEFKKQLDGQQKMNKEKTKLKRTLSKAADALKGGMKKGNKPENAQMAYVQAMNTMMDGNLSAMGASAEHMKMLNTPMVDANNQLNSLSARNDQLTTAYCSDASQSKAVLEQMQELNTQLSVLNTNIGNLGSEATRDSTLIKFAATENNAQAGNAAQTVDFVHKSERTKHL